MCGGGTGGGGGGSLWRGRRGEGGGGRGDLGRGRGERGVRACWVFLKVTVGWGFGDLREKDVLDARRGWFSLGDGMA